MGKDGAGLPLSLKVKNTFIDINSGFQEEEIEGDDLQQDAMRQRQFSEPAPFTRNLSAPAPSPMRHENVGRQVSQPIEEAPSEDLEEGQEPEQETDPGWRLMGRQDTDKAWGAATKWGRMETEQSWPSWGMQASSQDPSMQGYANGMWLYQPNFSGPAPWMMDNNMPPMPNISGVNSQTGSGAQTTSNAPTAVAPPPPGDMPESWASTTTVMMRNLPNKYTQHMLLEELNQSGFLGTFDFMYLPIDPDTHANRGYAFINFTSPSFAWMLKMSYEGRKMNSFNSDKVVSVAPAALQGFEANYAHYSTSRVNRGDPAARPLFLREPTVKPGQKPSGSRRRGGRRSSGSLIDLATREQQNHTGPQRASQPPAPAQAQPQPQQSQPSPAPAASGAVAAEGASSDGSGPRFCPFCGGKCQAHFRFCQFCGASLNLANAS